MKPADQERAEAILHAYGGNPDRWPANERTAVLERIKKSGQLLSLQHNARSLDNLIAKDAGETSMSAPETEVIAARINNSLPAQQDAMGALFTFFQQFMHRQPRFVQAGIGIAFLVLVMVIILPTNNRPTGHPTGQAAFEQWVWEDITGQSLTPNDYIAELTFMDLVDLEVDEG
ncbi:MAG: hypothetical protein BMS9Abin15_0237 [Gammaproteobacteria bacterium]|nr:MAG: hypothetical protein BMS9Abin15_0237 [Gammaproteobacteria bacterium]